MGNADLGEREKEVLEGRGRTETSPLGREGTSLGGPRSRWSRGWKGLRREALGPVENGRGKVGLCHTDPKGISEWWGGRWGLSNIRRVCSSLQAQHLVCFSFFWDWKGNLRARLGGGTWHNKGNLVEIKAWSLSIYSQLSDGEWYRVIRHLRATNQAWGLVSTWFPENWLACVGLTGTSGNAAASSALREGWGSRGTFLCSLIAFNLWGF